LRQTPRAILKEYLAKKGLLGQIVELCSGKHAGQATASPDTSPATQPPGGIDKAMSDAFDAMKKRKGAEAISDAIEKLPDAQRVAVDGDFELVNELAYDRGVEAILEEAAFRKLDWAGRVAKMRNHYERALWAFLEDPDLFYVAGHFGDMDRRGPGKRRTIHKDLVPKVEQEDLDALAAAIIGIYKPLSGCRFSKVDNYLRQSPERHCYFVYPEDHAVTEPSYDAHGKLKPVPRRPVLEVIFVYRPADGVLELWAKGNQEHKEELMRILCQTILGLKDLPDKDPVPDYDLSGLKDRNKDLSTDAEDGVDAVDIKMLRIGMGARGRRITFEANPSRGAPKALYDLVDSALNKQNVPLESVHVERTRIRLTFAPVNGGRQRTLTFEIGYPDFCGLTDAKDDQIARKCLKRWKIARE
jgi:hypothetical protein